MVRRGIVVTFGYRQAIGLLLELFQCCLRAVSELHSNNNKITQKRVLSGGFGKMLEPQTMDIQYFLGLKFLISI